MPVFVVFGLLRWLKGESSQLTNVIRLCTYGIYLPLVELQSNIYRYMAYATTLVSRAHVKTRHQDLCHLGRYSLIAFFMQTFSRTLAISTRAHDILFDIALFWDQPFLKADVDQYKGYWKQAKLLNIRTRKSNISRVQKFCYRVPFCSTPGPVHEPQCTDFRNLFCHHTDIFCEMGLNLTLVFLNDQPDLVVGILLTWKPHRQNRLSNPFRAVRVGEAKNPGPTQKLRIAITNPTSIVSKCPAYQYLHQAHNVDIMLASETAATRLSQKIFSSKMKPAKLRVCWSTPAPDQFERLDGRDSMRGKATGVAIITSLPIRDAVGTVPQDLTVTSRIKHVIVDYGSMQIQLVTIYGLPGTYPQSQQFNNDLLLGALEATSQILLPTVIGGDFNTDPTQLPAFAEARQRGFLDLKRLHRTRHGVDMTPTCKEATTPDNALCCPRIQSWLNSIQVFPEPIFDAHKIVFFDLHIPMETQYRKIMPLPKSWLELPIQETLIPQAYNQVVRDQGVPQSLEQWGERIEAAVDGAYRATQLMLNPECAHPKPLPAAYRGRCKPPKLTKVPLRTLMPKHRPGEYQPEHELHTFAELKVTIQLRRIQSLLRRLRKYDAQPSKHKAFRQELTHEWRVILRQSVFSMPFALWMQEHPELGPPCLPYPSYEMLLDIEQIFAHSVRSFHAQQARIHKQKHEYLQHLDNKEGGKARNFRIMKDAPSTNVEAIMTEIKDVGIVAPMSDQGMVEVYTSEAANISTIDPIYLDGHIARVHQTYPDRIVVCPTTPLSEDTEQVNLEQRHISLQKRRIFDRLNEFWTPYWLTGSDVTLEQSDQFANFLSYIPDLPPVQVETNDIQIWKTALQQMKSKTARGVDGIAVDEMRMLPDEALHHLAHLCNTAYVEGFPEWLMMSRTIPLSKTTTIPMASQTRPICVLAVIYRLWGRVVCSQVLSQLSKRLPPSLTGFLKGRGPLQAAYRQQAVIEQAHFFGNSLTGLSLDLIKCFNTIARAAGSAALRKLQLPEVIVKQYESSLQQLSRIWIIDGECSAIVKSKNGYPEGDVFSVIVILALSFGWICTIGHFHPETKLTAYADNWGWYVTNTLTHRGILILTKQYTAAALMKIDWAKTWLWSTSKSLVQLLKRIASEFIEASVLQVVLTQSDLGCQMTYRGPPRLGKQKDRLQAAKNRLKNLSDIRAELQHKVTMVLNGAYAVAFYGSEFLPLGESHLTDIRTAVSDAIFGPSTTRNSAITLACTPGLIDPMLYVILTAIRSARHYLLQVDQAGANKFLKIASRATGLAHSCRGPASCLKYFLLKLGWTISPSGDLHVGAFLSLNIMQHSFQQIARKAQQSWNEHLLLFFSYRKSISTLLPISSVDTKQILRKFSSKQCHCLMREIAAAFQTRLQQSKWDSNVDSSCVYCGAEDTRWHRVFECPAFTDIRENFQETIAFYLERDTSIHELPVIHIPRDHAFVEQMFYAHPEINFDETAVTKINALAQQLADHGQYLNMYTDGSCIGQESPTTRFSAYSVVADLCKTDCERKQHALTFQQTAVIPSVFLNLAAARVTGDQGIHRAEKYAILAIADNFNFVTVHIDSQVALNLAFAAQKAQTPYDLEGDDDFDIAIRLWLVLRDKSINFVKVKAHQDVSQTQDLLTVFFQLGNQMADNLATLACKSHIPALASQYQQMHSAHQKEKEHLHNWYQMLLAFSEKRLQLDKNNQLDHDTNRVTINKTRCDYLDLFSRWTISRQWKPPTICFRTLGRQYLG